MRQQPNSATFAMAASSSTTGSEGQSMVRVAITAEAVEAITAHYAASLNALGTALGESC